VIRMMMMMIIIIIIIIIIINQTGIDKQTTHAWLGRSNIFPEPESEGYMFAMQGAVVL
jgi:hypothetical protein